MFAIFGGGLLFALADDKFFGVGILSIASGGYLFLASTIGFASAVSSKNSLSPIIDSVSFVFDIFYNSFLTFIASDIGFVSIISGSIFLFPIVNDSFLSPTTNDMSLSIYSLA